MAEDEAGPEQPALLPEPTPATPRRRRATTSPASDPAPEMPVARVIVDVPLAHLDRTFDYLVPASMHESVAPGTRVKVRFAGQDVVGYVVERAERSDHDGRLSPLRRSVSAERVLSPAVATLVGRVAARYAGTRSDVLRLAIPSRHATTEKREPDPPAPLTQPAPSGQTWSGYTHGVGFVRALAAGESPRAVWSALPDDDWPRSAGRGGRRDAGLGTRGAALRAGPQGRRRASTPPSPRRWAPGGTWC